MTLEESDGISCRDEELLSSRVRRLSEAEPSCSSHDFALKQRLSPLDIPRFRNGTAKPLPATGCVLNFPAASGRFHKEMFPNLMAEKRCFFDISAV